MLKDKRVGLKLIIVGVLANNYVYLHDLILGKHEGAILLGPGEWIGIVLTLIVIADGVVIVLRSQAGTRHPATQVRRRRPGRTE